jgi:hypothetical protein
MNESSDSRNRWPVSGRRRRLGIRTDRGLSLEFAEKPASILCLYHCHVLPARSLESIRQDFSSVGSFHRFLAKSRSTRWHRTTRVGEARGSCGGCVFAVYSDGRHAPDCGDGYRRRSLFDLVHPIYSLRETALTRLDFFAPTIWIHEDLAISPNLKAAIDHRIGSSRRLSSSRPCAEWALCQQRSPAAWIENRADEGRVARSGWPSSLSGF